MTHNGNKKNPHYYTILEELRTTSTSPILIAEKYGVHYVTVYRIAKNNGVDLNARKHLPGEHHRSTGRYTTNNRFTIYITKKGLGVLNEQAAARDISRSELIRGVLNGTYSIKDALGEDDLTNYTESIQIVAPTSMIEDLGDIAYDAKISRSQAVRDILYERL